MSVTIKFVKIIVDFFNQMIYRGLKLIPNIYENFIKNSKAHRFILSGRSFPFPMKPRCSGRRGISAPISNAKSGGIITKFTTLISPACIFTPSITKGSKSG